MIQGNYEQDDIRLYCEMVAYKMTKERLQQGDYISDYSMQKDIEESDRLVWPDSDLIKRGIKKARKDYGQAYQDKSVAT